MLRKISKSQWVVLLGLACIFILPAPTAYWCYLHPAVCVGKPTNQGQLLSPPVRVSGLTALKKWRLVYLAEVSCGATCFSALEQLAKVRLALGRRAYDLNVALVTQAALSTQAKAMLQDEGIELLHDFPKALEHAPVWIVNPDGFAVMSYVDANRTQDIFHDLQQLIR